MKNIFDIWYSYIGISWFCVFLPLPNYYPAKPVKLYSLLIFETLSPIPSTEVDSLCMWTSPIGLSWVLNLVNGETGNPLTHNKTSLGNGVAQICPNTKSQIQLQEIFTKNQIKFQP